MPLRLKETFDYRPGAARVGGDIVLCGAGLGGREGVRELLEDGSAGEDLGLGLGCPDRGSSVGVRTGISPHGFVLDESGTTQHLPNGNSRSLPLYGTFTRVHDTWLVHTREGQVGMLGPDGASPFVLDLPEAITDVAAPPDSSSWVVLLPDSQGQDAVRPYVLDSTDGSWFTAGWAGLDPTRVAVRDGLAVTRSHPWSTLEFARAHWDAPLRADLDVDAGFTVVDDAHVLIADDRDVRLLRIPLDFPGENEAAYEVLWKYPVPGGESLAGSYPGMLWHDLVLLPLLREIWAFPTDGSEPYPFLPGELSYRASDIYFGSEFITAMTDVNRIDDTGQIIRRAVGGELEVVAEGVLGFQDRPWTPDLGRILYAVRDGDDVSIRQHRLTD